MSVVVAKVTPNQISLSADSGVFRYQTVSKDKDAKIFKVSDDFGIAGVGTLKDISLFFLFAKTRSPSTPSSQESLLEFYSEFVDWYKKKLGTLPDSSFLVVWKGHVYYIDDYLVYEIKDSYALGAGMDYATAALYFGKSSEEAVKVACELCVYCAEPVVTYTFNR